MAINISELTSAAAFGTSKNSYLQRILALCQQYNSSSARQRLYGAGAGTDKMRTAELDTIMAIVADYLTSKQPGTGTKGGARWTAMTHLAESCASEAQSFGAKQLTSPSDFREIKGDPALGKQSYWLELVDAQHRPGFWLSAQYELWLQAGRTKVSEPAGQPKVYKDFWTSINGNTPMSVVMLDDNTRRQFEVTLGADGILRDFLDQPATTRDMSTAASGSGWAIFVLSQDGQLYINSHKVGIFHHSSFLSGGAAAAAGEICVDETGRIRVITNKTGHYRAGIEEMIRLVTMLPVEPLTAILPDYHDALHGSKISRIYDAGVFRSVGVAAPELRQSVVKARIPAWASGSPPVQAILRRIADKT